MALATNCRHELSLETLSCYLDMIGAIGRRGVSHATSPSPGHEVGVENGKWATRSGVNRGQASQRLLLADEPRPEQMTCLTKSIRLVV